jgi:hypothetical protein
MRVFQSPSREGEFDRGGEARGGACALPEEPIDLVELIVAFDLATFPRTRIHGRNCITEEDSPQLVTLWTHGKIPGTELPAADDERRRVRVFE